MPENFEENLEKMKDVEASEKESKEPGLELAKNEQLDRVVDVANNLDMKMKGDMPVTNKDVLKLEEALGQMKINICGEEMTVEELRKSPEAKIWQEIKNGDISRHSELRFMTPEIAKILSRQRKQEFLDFSNLEYSSDEVIKNLSDFTAALHLTALRSLSNRSAEYLSQHQGGYLSLSSISTLSDKAVESLSKYQGELNFSGLVNISDEAVFFLVEKYKTGKLDVSESIDVRLKKIIKDKK